MERKRTRYKPYRSQTRARLRIISHFALLAFLAFLWVRAKGAVGVGQREEPTLSWKQSDWLEFAGESCGLGTDEWEGE